uniref:hypothetical protein n=1 Tax=Algoriphagus sp. TaxID=1872435 RepID=UPI00258AF053|nr:hypothetical protein [Algoriphagus sp.]
MKKPFYSLGLGTLALMIFWSCTLEEIASPQQAVLVDPLPVARSYYDLEKAQVGESICSNPVGSGSVSLLGGSEELF